MLLCVPITAEGASQLSTEQKFEVLKQNNIVTGFTDGSARLYDSVSREQLAAVLFRLLELQAQGSAPSYDDVLTTRWSYHEIEAVSRAKLMNGTKTRVFSPQANVTVEQLAVIFIRSYGLSGVGSTPVTGTVSKWARGAVSLALDRHLIPQLSDYTVDATRGLLVEAAYAVYEDTRIEPLRIRSVEQLSNQSVKVSLLQRINDVDKSRFSIKDINGNSRTIYQATLNPDGMSVVLWTDRQIGGVVHTLYVDGISWNYVSAQEDTTKPFVTSQPVRLPNRALEVTFSEPVEQNSATNASNYQLNNGLKIVTLQLSSDQRKVTFTTSEQSDGRTYQLTIQNVKDLAGNVMDKRSDLYFTGNNDYTKPKVSEVKIDVNTALISVKFNEKVDAQQAVQTYHYSIDNGLTVTQANLGSDGQTVTLRTSPQQDRQIYNLTISGIPDLAGNVMDTSTNWKFGAVSNPIAEVHLASVRAIDQNTLEVSFDRTIKDSDVNSFKLTILKDNGSGVSMSDWSSFVQRTPGSDRAVTIQFRTKSSNPELFKTGHLYTARASGVTGLVTANEADQKEFAGTVIANPAPYVTQVVVINRKSVKVIFSEAVTKVDKSAFRIRERDGDAVGIDYDEVNDKGKIVNEVVLRLKDELQGNKGYEMSFQSNVITDAAGWNGLKTMEGSNPYVVYFNGN